MQIPTGYTFQKPKFIAWAFFIFFSHSAQASDFDLFLQSQVKPLIQKSWDPTSQKILASGVIAVWGSNSLDQKTQEQWRDHQKISAANSDVGDRLVTYGIGPLIAGAQYIWDRDNSYPHLRALISTTLVTSSMKLSFGRERPDQSDHYSFPSGHSSSAFATATALSESYGWKLGVVAYPVATFVALSRLADNKHWLSDVMSGAFVGVWLGRASSFESHSTTKPSWILLPTFQNENLGALYRYEF